MSKQDPKKTPIRRKTTYTATPLPVEGFVRLPLVLAYLGISRSAYLCGAKQGIYPAGKLISTRTRVYDVAEIRAIAEKLSA